MNHTCLCLPNRSCWRGREPLGMGYRYRFSPRRELNRYTGLAFLHLIQRRPRVTSTVCTLCRLGPLSVYQTVMSSVRNDATNSYTNHYTLLWCCFLLRLTFTLFHKNPTVANSNFMVSTDTDIYPGDTSRILVVQFRLFVAILLSVSSSSTEFKFTKQLVIYGDWVNDWLVCLRHREVITDAKLEGEQ